VPRCLERGEVGGVRPLLVSRVPLLLAIAEADVSKHSVTPRCGVALYTCNAAMRVVSRSRFACVHRDHVSHALIARRRKALRGLFATLDPDGTAAVTSSALHSALHGWDRARGAGSQRFCGLLGRFFARLRVAQPGLVRRCGKIRGCDCRPVPDASPSGQSRGRWAVGQ
jgi:hypothetical protein